MMELLLVRHGKAQDRRLVSIDHERKLVPKGTIQLKQDIPYLTEYLGDRKNVFLWSSGITRALETAEIIQELCKIDDIEVYDFIETGDFYELERSLKKMGEDSTIVIVGHQPDLSEWTRMICKKIIDFKKGGAVSFKIISTDQLSGEINWIAEPGKYMNIPMQKL